MSYIVPREKPKVCRNCGFLDRNTYDCKLMRDKDYEDFDIQYANCPLVEVPPHGRLIDADDVNNHILGYVDLRDCPTIIEAEGSTK